MSTAGGAHKKKGLDRKQGGRMVVDRRLEAINQINRWLNPSQKAAKALQRQARRVVATL
jgi:U3 small nucleolar RNA-associated protein 14